MITVLHGDCAGKLPELAAESVDAIVTDPPYGLEFMGKEWDRFSGSVTDRDFKGFVLSQQRTRNVKCPDCGKWAYDHPGRLCACGGIRRAQFSAYQAWCETWAAECLRVLKPGGHLLAFGGTRTYHRLVCAIEDAGPEIRDSLHWMYGSGFPKSLNAARAIDRHMAPGDPEPPLSAEGEPWTGWGTALKPGHEPIVLARKPLTGTVAANVLAHGTGALNVDGCRVATNEAIASHHSTANPRVAMGDGWHDAYKPGDAGKFLQTSGRWPPNILLTHSAECSPAGARKVRNPSGSIRGDEPSAVADAVYAGRQRVPWRAHGDADGTETVEAWDCAPGCPVATLDAQSGTLHSQDPRTRRSGKVSGGQIFERPGMSECYADKGGASRFFPQFDWSPEYDAPFMYQAKAGRKERPRIDGLAAHPTVKPLALMRWLVRLVTPPGGLVLDPFAGTGTTGEACHLEGFDCVLIERDADYIKLIEARMGKYAQEAA